jgi:outer membrane protein TolC
MACVRAHDFRIERPNEVRPGPRAAVAPAVRHLQTPAWVAGALPLLCFLFQATGSLPTSFLKASVPASPTSTTDAVLDQLIAESLAVRPELKEAERTLRAEEERVPQAGALPDPVLTLGIQNDGFTSIEIGKAETSFLLAMASQSFPWPGKRGLREDAARLGASEARAALARARLGTEAEVRVAYLELLLARERLQLLAERTALWEESERVAHARYEAGEGPQSDLLRAQLERARLEQGRLALAAEERVRTEALNRLRAHPLDERIRTRRLLEDLPDPTPAPSAEEISDAEARSPELAIARLSAERADVGVELAHRDLFPDLGVSAGVMPRGGLPPMWQAGLSVNVPIFAGTKQNRAIAESEARQEARRSGVLAIEQVLRQRVAERMTALGALLETLRLYRGGLLAQSHATAESTLTQYRVGRVTLVSVLEAIAGYIGDEEAYLETIVTAQRVAIARAEVSLAPTGVSGPPGMGGGSMPGATAIGNGSARAMSNQEAPTAAGGSSEKMGM